MEKEKKKAGRGEEEGTFVLLECTCLELGLGSPAVEHCVLWDSELLTA